MWYDTIFLQCARAYLLIAGAIALAFFCITFTNLLPDEYLCFDEKHLLERLDMGIIIAYHVLGLFLLWVISRRIHRFNTWQFSLSVLSTIVFIIPSLFALGMVINIHITGRCD